MKNIYIRFLLILIPGLLFGSCEEQTYEFGEPFSKLQGINGTFVLSAVSQIDERTTALDNSLDISDFFIGVTPAVISFNSTDFTYTLNSGTSPNFLGENSGSWRFDDNEFPTEIQLGSGNPTSLLLNRTIREIDNTLEFQVSRFCSGTAGVSYRYIFTRQ